MRMRLLITFSFRYSRDTLVRIINEPCKNRYDFLYLPMDQVTHCNMGYGYINMIDLPSVILLYEKVLFLDG